MAKADAEKLDEIVDKYSDKMPRFIRRFVLWLRRPELRWVRLIVGVLFVLLGCVGFLPVLGFWMVPLGLILLAQDIQFLQRPILSAILWAEDKAKRWQQRKR
jgi:4-alpha-glucanotransferase